MAFDRSTLTGTQLHILNRAYVQISTTGIDNWVRRYRALTNLPSALLDEIEKEYDR